MQKRDSLIFLIIRENYITEHKVSILEIAFFVIVCFSCNLCTFIS